MGLGGSKTDTAIFNLQNGAQITIKYSRGAGLGFVPWPGSFALGAFLDARAEELGLRGKRALELGSGACSVAGLVAGHLCKEVVLTDRLEVIGELAAHAQAAEESGMPSRWDAKVLDWTDLDFTFHSFEQGNYDIIMMSDVVYYDFLWEPLMHTLFALCTESTQVLWANCDKYPEYTPNVKSFLELVERYFHVEVLEDREQSHCDGPSATAGGRVVIRSLRLADRELAEEELTHALHRGCARRCFMARPTPRAPAEAHPRVAQAAATGDWSGAVVWALRRALEAVPHQGRAASLLEKARGELQWALQAQAETGETVPQAAAGIYLSMLSVQGLLAPEEKAAFDLVARYVRDAVVMTVVKLAGGHGDMERFNAALRSTFPLERVSPDDNQLLYAQMHMSYQVLFKGVQHAFASNAKRQGRANRPARADRHPPHAGPGGGASGTEPEAEQVPAMEPDVLEEGTPGARADEGGGPPPHVPRGLSCEHGWRCDVEALLSAVACPATAGAVCRGCVKDLQDIMDLSREWLGNLWSQGLPGQRFCGRLLDTLSGAVRRFPKDTHMHAVAIKILVTVCEDRGDILGLQFPGDAQPEPSMEYALATRNGVREACFTAQAADRSDSSFLHEERVRLLVRTQKLPDLLRALGEDSNGIYNNVRLSDQNLLLQQAKNGLDFHIKHIALARAIDTKEHAFLREVLNQQQRRSYHTQDWVQGGDFGCGSENTVDRVRMRFTVAGLLFGFEEQILTPIRTSHDTHMLLGALKSVRTMVAIMPLSEGTSRAVVDCFRSIDVPLHQRSCKSSEELSAVWMECEATILGTMGTVLKGSISQDNWPHDVIRWAVKKACDAVDHAINVSIVKDMQYHASVVSIALWCLIEVLDGAEKLPEEFADSVNMAAQQAVQHLSAVQDLPFARMALSNAVRLFEKVHGPCAAPEWAMA